MLATLALLVHGFVKFSSLEELARNSETTSKVIKSSLRQVVSTVGDRTRRTHMGLLDGIRQAENRVAGLAVGVAERLGGTTAGPWLLTVTA